MDTEFHSEPEAGNSCFGAHVFSLLGRMKESCWSNQIAVCQELASATYSLFVTTNLSRRRHFLVMIQWLNSTGLESSIARRTRHPPEEEQFVAWKHEALMWLLMSCSWRSYCSFWRLRRGGDASQNDFSFQTLLSFLLLELKVTNRLVLWSYDGWSVVDHDSALMSIRLAASGHGHWHSHFDITTRATSAAGRHSWWCACAWRMLGHIADTCITMWSFHHIDIATFHQYDQLIVAICLVRNRLRVFSREKRFNSARPDHIAAAVDSSNKCDNDSPFSNLKWSYLVVIHLTEQALFITV